MVKKGLRIIGATISISFVMFIALAVFIKSLGILFNDWFTNNAIVISAVSGFIVLLGIITGTISIRKLTSSGKGIFD